MVFFPARLGALIEAGHMTWGVVVHPPRPGASRHVLVVKDWHAVQTAYPFAGLSAQQALKKRQGRKIAKLPSVETIKVCRARRWPEFWPVPFAVVVGAHFLCPLSFSCSSHIDIIAPLPPPSFRPPMSSVPSGGMAFTPCKVPRWLASPVATSPAPGSCLSTPAGWPDRASTCRPASFEPPAERRRR